MSVERTREVMNRYFTSAHSDVSMMADDVVFIMMATGDETKTPAGVLAMLNYFYHVAFDATADIKNTAFDDGKALVEGDVIGKHIGEFAGIPATGNDQVYGAGGLRDATFLRGYVELFNRGSTTVDITGWSVQYAGSAGTAFFSANVTPLIGSLAPGQYYLVRLGFQDFGQGAPLPTPDASNTTQMNGAAGKVVLVNTTTGLTCNGSTGQPCSAAQRAQIVDLVGYGTTANFFEGSGPTPTPTTLLPTALPPSAS